MPSSHFIGVGSGMVLSESGTLSDWMEVRGVVTTISLVQEGFVVMSNGLLQNQ